MTRKNMIIAIGCCVLFSSGITLFDYKKNQSELSEELSGYTQANAIVEKVYPPRITKYGSKQNSYDLVVTLSNGATLVMYRKKISASLKEGDHIVILYNPKAPHEHVYLK